MNRTYLENKVPDVDFILIENDISGTSLKIEGKVDVVVYTVEHDLAIRLRLEHLCVLFWAFVEFIVDYFQTS